MVTIPSVMDKAAVERLYVNSPSAPASRYLVPQVIFPPSVAVMVEDPYVIGPTISVISGLIVPSVLIIPPLTAVILPAAVVPSFASMMRDVTISSVAFASTVIACPA